MEVKSIYRSARISAFKVREVTRQIQGLPATDALDLLRFTPKKAAELVGRTLKSAVANAENNNKLRVDSLVIKEAVAGEGTTIKRFTPKARGSAGPIRKRTSHIFITLTDEIPIVRREKISTKKKGKSASTKKESTKGSAKAAKPAPETSPAPTETSATPPESSPVQSVAATEPSTESSKS